MKTIRMILLFAFAVLTARAQLGERKTPGSDTSRSTRILLDTCKVDMNEFVPVFNDVPINIPLGKDDYQDNFNWEPASITISRGFIYAMLDSLDIRPTGQLNLRLPQLDYDHYTNRQIETILLTVLCHEYGHFLRKLYNDTLMKEEGPADVEARRQRVEYTCDFISGFMSAKTLWRQYRERLFSACGSDNRDKALGLIETLIDSNATMEPDTTNLDPAFGCLESAFLQYKKTDLLIKYGTDCDHGLGEERKKAFDAGIFFAIYDGTAKEVFEDEKVRLPLMLFLALHHLTLDQAKRRFVVNLTHYLIRRKKMNAGVTPVLHPYTGPELYVAAFRYSLKLKENSANGCIPDLRVPAALR